MESFQCINLLDLITWIIQQKWLNKKVRTLILKREIQKRKSLIHKKVISVGIVRLKHILAFPMFSSGGSYKLLILCHVEPKEEKAPQAVEVAAVKVAPYHNGQNQNTCPGVNWPNRVKKRQKMRKICHIFQTFWAGRKAGNENI